MIKFTQVEYLGAILVFAIGGILIYFLSKRWKIEFRILLVFWTIKLFLSFFYVYVFSEFYISGQGIQGDSYNFLNDSKELNQVAFNSPTTYLKLIVGTEDEAEIIKAGYLKNTQIWDAGNNGDWINDNRLIIKINSVIHFFSNNNVYVHSLILSFLAFLGIVFIYLTFQQYIYYKQFFLTALFLFPSIGFWGSGLTKEALLIFSMGLFLINLKKILTDKFLLKYIFLFAISILILLLNKPYAGLMVVLFATVFIVGKLVSWKKIGLYLYALFILISVTLLCYAPEKFNLVHKISVRQHDMINLAKGGIFFITDSSFCAFDAQYANNFDTLNNKIQVLKDTPGEYKLFGQKEFYPFQISKSNNWYDLYLMINPSSSYFEISEINYQPKNLVLTLPEVFYNSLLRPLPGDIRTGFVWVILIQNLSLLALFIVALIKRKVTEAIEKYLIFYLVICAIFIIILIGWTTPVFGAMARYKIPTEIFLLTTSFILLKPKQKLKNE